MTKRLYTMAMLALFSRELPVRQLQHEDGQTLAEYALILAFIALLVIGALIFLQGNIQSLFSQIATKL